MSETNDVIPYLEIIGIVLYHSSKDECAIDMVTKTTTAYQPASVDHGVRCVIS